MQTIKIEYPIANFNLNKYTSLARANKYASSSHKKKIETDLYYIIKSQKVKFIKTPCTIKAIWQIKNETADLDNLLLKSILDTLQTMQLIENDNMKHIKSISHDYVVNKSWQGVILEFMEVSRI